MIPDLRRKRDCVIEKIFFIVSKVWWRDEMPSESEMEAEDGTGSRQGISYDKRR